jgi:ppGpp synthetase/RelA/SpoT-type nucleotidyltranferase
VPQGLNRGGLARFPHEWYRLGVLQRSDVQAIRARYEGQHHHFVALAHAVEHFVAEALHGAGLRHMVASRAKSPDSLEHKLWRRRERWEASDFRDRLSPPLRDLAGVRVLLYLEQDSEPAVGTLVQQAPRFGQLWSPPTPFDEHNRPGGYRAVHLHLARSDGVPCEVQVCTLTAHLWNELEHDIVYKQDGEATPPQKELLFALRGALDLSGLLAGRLVERTRGR